MKKMCDKKRVNKNFIETAVIEIALWLLNDAPILNYIVDGCYEVQLKSSATLPACA